MHMPCKNSSNGQEYQFYTNILVKVSTNSGLSGDHNGFLTFQPSLALISTGDKVPCRRLSFFGRIQSDFFLTPAAKKQNFKLKTQAKN